MASVHDDGGVGKARDAKVYMRNRLQKVQNHQQIHQQRHRKSPTEPRSQCPLQYSKATSKPTYSHQWPRLADGGPGMQAIFIESKQRSYGTGVFIPQISATTNFQPSKIKPACATVLLPARVVEALNLNVHALGVQISPPQVHKYDPRCGAVYNNNSTKKKSDQKDVSQHCSVISQNQSSSPEIFLPKEWTY